MISESTDPLGMPARGPGRLPRSVAVLPRSVAVVGRGRLGASLAAALETVGVEVRGPLGRGAREQADAVLLCVPDTEIAAAAAAVRGMAALVGHTSGATGLDALEPAGAAAFGMHPLQTFAGGERPERFHAVGCAVAG